MYQNVLLLLADDTHKKAGTIEKPMGIVQMGRSYGKIPSINIIGKHKNSGNFSSLPGLFIQFFQVDSYPITCRLDIHNIFGKIPNHITTRNPCRQGKSLPLGIWIGNPQYHRKNMRFGKGWMHAILND